MSVWSRRSFSFSCCCLAILTCSCDAGVTSSDSGESPAAEKRGVAYQTEPGPEDADAPTEFTQTDSGLRYRVLRKSDGPMPSASNKVFVHYVGWLDTGEEFDSTYNDGKPIGFRLKDVIAGWTEGIQLVGKGGMIELEIPSELGYGEDGAGDDIPPNSTLHFKVELIAIF